MRTAIVIGIAMLVWIFSYEVYSQSFLAINNTPPAESYLIRPGVSVGPISIGMLRAEVLSLAGDPVSSLSDGDNFSGFVVHYVAGRVSEIMVISSLYRTAEGIFTESEVKQFLAIYPKAKRICYVDSGASSITRGFVYDAVDRGIAYERTVFEYRSREVINTITIHRANVPVKIYESVTPCENM
jgi:hypothetical protein